MTPRTIVTTLLMAMSLTAVAAPAAAQSPAPGSPDVIDDVSVVIIQLRDPDGSALEPDQVEGARAVVEARLDALPGPGATVTIIPGDRIRIDIADPGQLEAVTRVATAPGVFRIVGLPSERAHEAQEARPLPADIEVDEIVGPGHVVHAEVGQDQLGGPAIDLELDRPAADAFDAWAADHVGEMAALVLDDIVVATPIIQASDFDGHVQISGSFDTSQLEEFVAVLSGGSLSVLAEPLPDCLPAACPVASRSPAPSVAP